MVHERVLGQNPEDAAPFLRIEFSTVLNRVQQHFRERHQNLDLIPVRQTR